MLWQVARTDHTVQKYACEVLFGYKQDYIFAMSTSIPGRAISLVGIDCYHGKVVGSSPRYYFLPRSDISHAPYGEVTSSSPKHNIILVRGKDMLPQSGLELATPHTTTMLRTHAGHTTHMYPRHVMMMRRESCASLIPTIGHDNRCQYLSPWYPYLSPILDTFDPTARLDVEQRAPVSLLTISNSLAT